MMNNEYDQYATAFEVWVNPAREWQALKDALKSLNTKKKESAAPTNE